MPSQTNLPEQTNQNQDPPSAGSPPPQPNTDATNQRTDTEDPRFAALEKRFADYTSVSAREMAELRATNNRIAALLERQSAPPPETINYPDTKGWLDNPQKFTDEIVTKRINEALERTALPMQQWMQRQEAQRAYDNLKAKYRAQYGDNFTSVESDIDNIIESNVIKTGQQVTADVINGAFKMAYGDAMLAGRLKASTPSTNSRDGGDRMTPITHVPNNPAPDGRPRQPTPEFTETERALFNRAKMIDDKLTEVEWAKLRDGGTRGDSSSMKVGAM